MTLDEAIKHCEEKAAELREYSDVLSETSTIPKGKEISDCLECAEEHEQLAEWLKELKALKEMPKGDLISRSYVEKIVGSEFVDLQDGTDEWRTYVNDTCESILTKVHNAPSIEQEVYIDGEDYNFFIRGYKEGRKDFEKLRGEWIPVSERTPDDRVDTYWVCTEDGYQCQCRWTNVNPFWTNLETDWHWCHFDIPQYQEVIAWQPLPEPYKEGGAK